MRKGVYYVSATHEGQEHLVSGPYVFAFKAKEYVDNHPKKESLKVVMQIVELQPVKFTADGECFEVVAERA